MGKRKRNPVGEGSLMDERNVHCSMEHGRGCGPDVGKRYIFFFVISKDV